MPSLIVEPLLIVANIDSESRAPQLSERSEDLINVIIYARSAAVILILEPAAAMQPATISDLPEF
jgi:hypothetical protein